MSNNEILITGVAKGLGNYLAQNLSQNKYKIIGLDLFEKKDIDPDLLNILHDYITFDLTNLNEIETTIQEIITKHNHIDILINNAGLKYFKLFQDIDQKEILNIYQVNTLAPLFLIKSVIPSMLKNNYGRIINISSNAGFQGYKKGSLYCSSKAALNIFTEAVGSEIIAKNVTINTIAPGNLRSFENTDSEQKKLIHPDIIFKTILKLIISKKSGNVIPIISFKRKIIYLLKNIQKHFCWIFKIYNRC